MTSTRTRPRVLVVSGRGRFEDPWHDTAATSHEIATILTGTGLDVEVRGTFPGVFDDLDHDSGAGRDRHDVALVVVNGCLSRPVRDDAVDGTDAQWSVEAERLIAWARDGGSLLVVHQGIRTFEGMPQDAMWREVVGGRWVEGVSWHPPRGPFDLEVVDREHPVTAALGVPEAVADDEAYTDLEVGPSVRALVAQRHDGVDHPLVWVQTAHGGRTVYDALGHDDAATRDPLRRELLAREARWLVAPGPTGADAPLDVSR